MKAVRLHPAEMPNPLYSQSAKRIAKQQGVPYETKPFLLCPAGETVEDRNVWIHCLSGLMAPADDECRQRVLKELGSEKRQALLGKIKAVRLSDGVERLPKSDREWLEHMERAYASELGLAPPVVTATEIIETVPEITPEPVTEFEVFEPVTEEQSDDGNGFDVGKRRRAK